jgi:NAD(P)-dependent dehydrogenase (short-subunit alcohol dehydrogenase family)
MKPGRFTLGTRIIRKSVTPGRMMFTRKWEEALKVNELRFNGQVAIVTGAGRGIGRQYALELAQRGAAVVVNDSAATHADNVVTEIQRAGGTAVASHDTVSTFVGGKAIAQAALANFGRLDVLINNAGFIRNAYFEDLTPEQISDVIDVHLLGAFHVTQPCWRAMKAQAYGRIVMTGSGSGMFGRHAGSNYCAAKAGLYGLVKALAYEGAEHGIKVNLVLPFAQTSIQDEQPVPDIAATMAKFLTVEEERRIQDRGNPDLVAQLVAYLVSPECAISGEAFSTMAGRYALVFAGVTGGWLASDLKGISAETIREHLTEIRDTSTFSVPMLVYDEMAEVARRLSTLGDFSPKT